VQRLARLVGRVQSLPRELRVLDLCTGSGCIPLLFHHDLSAARADVELRVLGVDVSHRALQLAVHNLARVRRNHPGAHKGSVGYLQADVLANPFADAVHSRLAVSTALRRARLPHIWDILISNPPYISPSAYWKSTARSVRGFEPKLALVPPPKTGDSDAEQADAFYRPILDIASEVEAKLVLLEVAGLDQALRVARAAQALRIFDGVEIWRDQPDEPDDPSTETAEFPVLGQGNARSVVCWRGAGAAWLGKAEHACAYEHDVALAPVSLDAYFQVDPVTGLPTGGQLRPHWVKNLCERQKEEKHNAWRDLQIVAEQNTERENQRGETHHLKTQLQAALEIHNSKRPFAPPKGGTSIGNIRLNQEQQNLIIQYYQDGLKENEIADALGTDTQSVYRYLKRCLGLPIHSGRNLSLNEEQQKRLLHYYHNGWKIQAIADALERCKKTIRNYLVRHSVPSRNKKPKRVGRHEGES
jgi:predicted DNA-binding protein YlxM (UPF0122 family)